MSTDQPYVPNESSVRAAWRLYGGGDTFPDNDAEFDRFLARVRRDTQREAAQMIRDACDRWEVDGDDERLVNEVLDPWTSRILTPEETP